MLKILLFIIVLFTIHCFVVSYDDDSSHDKFPIGTIVKIDGKSCAVRTHAVFRNGLYWVTVVGPDNSNSFSWPQDKLEEVK